MPLANVENSSAYLAMAALNAIDYMDDRAKNAQAAIEAQIRLEPPATYKSGDQYATAKMLVAWWAAELSRRVPGGVTVNAVSPGSTPDTSFDLFLKSLEQLGVTGDQVAGFRVDGQVDVGHARLGSDRRGSR